MMSPIIKDRQVNVKVNSANFEEAKKVFKENGLDISSAFNQFIQEVAITHALPFKTEEEKRRDCMIEQLSQKFDENLDQMESGGGISLDDARRRLFT